MGQSLKKLAPGSEENREKEIGPVIEECYNKYFKERMREEMKEGKGQSQEGWDLDNLPAPRVCEEKPRPKLAHFYRAVCDTVEEINMKLNTTQIRLPTSEKLKEVYDVHFGEGEGEGGREREFTKQDFQKLLQEVVLYSGFTGFKSKNIFYYMLGIPVTALMIKQRLGPKALPNDLFIPTVTSATVFLLAKLNKI